LADHKIDKPQDIVKLGEEVEVKILRVDTDSRKIGLSLRRAQWAAEEHEAKTVQTQPQIPVGVQTVLSDSDFGKSTEEESSTAFEQSVEAVIESEKSQAEEPTPEAAATEGEQAKDSQEAQPELTVAELPDEDSGQTDVEESVDEPEEVQEEEPTDKIDEAEQSEQSELTDGQDSDGGDTADEKAAVDTDK
jgi:small subunit ribosomal protein S1